MIVVINENKCVIVKYKILQDINFEKIAGIELTKAEATHLIGSLPDVLKLRRMISKYQKGALIMTECQAMMMLEDEDREGLVNLAVREFTGEELDYIVENLSALASWLS